MLRPLIFVYFFVTAVAANGQNKFEWSGNFELTIDDFLGSGTEIGNVSVYSVQTGTIIEFSYQMTNAEFMITKNWNEKVRCMFNRGLAYLIAPDDSTANRLINFAQYDFDLGELYSRKLRKAIFDEKKLFSNSSMFQPLYDRIQGEYQERHVKVAKETDIGRKGDLLKKYHDEVLAEINLLGDFCRTCRPAKRKK